MKFSSKLACFGAGAALVGGLLLGGCEDATSDPNLQPTGTMVIPDCGTGTSEFQPPVLIGNTLNVRVSGSFAFAIQTDHKLEPHLRGGGRDGESEFTVDINSSDRDGNIQQVYRSEDFTTVFNYDPTGNLVEINSSEGRFCVSGDNFYQITGGVAEQ